MIDFDKILNDFTERAHKKREIALAKAYAEIKAIDREYEGYIDGVYAAVKAIKVHYEREVGIRERSTDYKKN